MQDLVELGVSMAAEELILILPCKENQCWVESFKNKMELSWKA